MEKWYVGEYNPISTSSNHCFITFWNWNKADGIEILIIIIIIIMSFTANIDNENNGGEINDNMNGWQTTLVVQE